MQIEEAVTTIEEFDAGAFPDIDLLNENDLEGTWPMTPEPEAEDAQATPDEQNSVVVDSDEDTDKQDHEKAAAKARRSVRGAVAHYMGNLLAAYVGRKIGAQRPEMFANHHQLIGTPFQIRTIQGSQNTFTINLATEPPKIIVVARNRKQASEEETRYTVYGVLRADATICSKKSKSPGHVKSEHHQVALTQVNRLQLGELVINNAEIHAETREQRRAHLQQIDAMDVDHQDAVIEKAREFICAEVMT